MTSDAGRDSGGRDQRPAASRPDSGHLDEDPEALEDPVHEGDARHQHKRHERHEPEPGQSAQRG
jgi:hypothetical protein